MESDMLDEARDEVLSDLGLPTDPPPASSSRAVVYWLLNTYRDIHYDICLVPGCQTITIYRRYMPHSRYFPVHHFGKSFYLGT